MLVKRDGPELGRVQPLEHRLQPQVLVVGASRQASEVVRGPRDLQLEQAPLWTVRPLSMPALARRPTCHNTHNSEVLSENQDDAC